MAPCWGGFSLNWSVSQSSSKKRSRASEGGLLPRGQFSRNLPVQGHTVSWLNPKPLGFLLKPCKAWIRPRVIFTLCFPRSRGLCFFHTVCFFLFSLCPFSTWPFVSFFVFFFFLHSLFPPSLFWHPSSSPFNLPGLFFLLTRAMNPPRSLDKPWSRSLGPLITYTGGRSKPMCTAESDQGLSKCSSWILLSLCASERQAHKHSSAFRF